MTKTDLPGSLGASLGTEAELFCLGYFLNSGYGIGLGSLLPLDDIELYFVALF